MACRSFNSRQLSNIRGIDWLSAEARPFDVHYLLDTTMHLTFTQFLMEDFDEPGSGISDEAMAKICVKYATAAYRTIRSLHNQFRDRMNIHKLGSVSHQSATHPDSVMDLEDSTVRLTMPSYPFTERVDNMGNYTTTLAPKLIWFSVRYVVDVSDSNSKRYLEWITKRMDRLNQVLIRMHTSWIAITRKADRNRKHHTGAR